jgi:hypothetical protein
MLWRGEIMNEKEALLLTSFVKDLLVRLMNLVVEVESETGLKVVSKEYLDALYAEATRKREWEK